MATHDYVLANQSGSSFRSDLNNALAAIVSQNSSATEPATKYAYQYWIDTSATPALIKQRNAANDAWVTLAEVDGQTLAADGTDAKPGISFAADVNTGIKREGTDKLAFVTAGTKRLLIDATGNVGIGTNSPGSLLHIASDSGGGTGRIKFGCNVSSGYDTQVDATDVGLEFTAKSNTRGFAFNTGSTPSEKIRITGGGFVGIGTTTPPTALSIKGTGVNDSRITVDRSGATANVGIVGNSMLLAANGSTGTNGHIEFYAGGFKRAELFTDGKLVLGGITPATSVNHSVCTAGRIETDATYSVTTSSSANVNIGSSGLLQRSTSSAKYKTNIETIEDSYADAVLNARPVWFNSTASEDTAHPEWGYWGFIAEEIHKIDPRLVFYGEDDDGNLEPEGVQYDRFIPHLVNLIKRQKDQIVDLTARIEALEAAS